MRKDIVNLLKSRMDIKIILRLLITILIIILAFGVYIFNNVDKKDVSVMNETSRILIASNTKIKDMPLDISIEGKLDNGSFLVKKNDDSKNAYSYNKGNDSLKKIVSVNNKSNFIQTILCNSNWIVWLENEAMIVNTNDKPFKWQIIAQNILTGEQIIVDKSSFVTNKFNVPMFINYSPDQIHISKEDVIAYCKTGFNNTKVTSEVLTFDLKTKTSNLIAKTDDVTSELIYDCSIYNNRVVWSKFRNLQDNYDTRLTQYLYSDIYMQDLNSKAIKQLTYNEYYYDTNQYEDKLVAIKIPLKNANQNACNSEIILIDMNTNKITTIVDENSACYKKVENELFRCSPIITDKYISWSNNYFSNHYIYDYKNNSFIDIYYDKKDNQDSIPNITNMYDNDVFLYISTVDKNNDKRFYLNVDSIICK